MTLKVRFEVYDRYCRNESSTATITRDTLRECLNVLLNHVSLYIDPEDPEVQESSDEELLDAIRAINGDGCDFISYLANVDTGDEYINISEYVEEEVW